MAEGIEALRWSPEADRLVALSRNAHRGVDRSDEVDYWYRLGQRNAYAHAAGLAVALEVDSDAFAVAERITTALSDGVLEVTVLRAAALAVPHKVGDPEVELAWVGPVQFHRQYSDLGGVDHDYGMRWGRRHDQRVSLRVPVDADHGLLYAYDPTWDEYAVLVRDVPVAAVEAAFNQCTTRSDFPLSVASFAAVVARQPLTPDPTAVTVDAEMQL